MYKATWSWVVDKKHKVIAFRPTDKEQAIIERYMKDHNLTKPSKAMKHIVNAISFLVFQQKERLEQTPKVESKYLPESIKPKLSYALEQELNRFLRGQGIDQKGNVTCPTIEAIFGLNANSKIMTIIHNP